MQSDSSSPQDSTLVLRQEMSFDGTHGGSSIVVPGPRSAALVSIQRQQMSNMAKAGQESTILMAVRKQLEALEDKLSAQVVRSQNQGDKAREVAFSRYESKLSTVESIQTRADRRLAELSGNLHGLSDEMQTQIRRIDANDSKWYEWRHQLEEEVRAKFSDLDAHNQNTSSTLRVLKATSDDMYKKFHQRLLRLEGLMEERVAAAEDTNQSILQLHTRLTEVEERLAERQRDLAITLSSRSQHAGAVATQRGFEVEDDEECHAQQHQSTLAIARFETHITDFQQNFSTIQNDINDMLSRLESQEERCRSLRTLHETKDAQFKALMDRLERDNVEGRFSKMQARMSEFESARLSTMEQLEIVLTKVDHNTIHVDELANAIRRLQERCSEALAGITPLSPSYSPALHSFGITTDFNSVASGVTGVTATTMDTVSYPKKIKEMEERLETLGLDVQTIRADQELGTRVGSLVMALKDIAPKVISHDTMLKQLQTDLSKAAGNELLLKQIQDEMGQATSRCTKHHDEIERTVGGVKGNVERLAVEVQRLIAEVEGADCEERSHRSRSVSRSSD